MITDSCIQGDKDEYISLLPMCENKNRETLKDLFNPLYVGFQILKRGFCLAYNNGALNSNVINKYPSYSDSNFVTQLETKYDYVNDSDYNSSSWEQSIPNFPFNSKQQLVEAFPFEVSTNFAFNIPVLSPTGFCINDGYSLHFLEKKKITCSYKFKCGSFNELLQKFSNYTRYYKIENGMITGVEDSQNELPKDTYTNGSCTKVIKKIELVFYFSGNNYNDYFFNATVYYQSIQIPNTDYISFQDVTYDFSFLRSDITNFPRSGNTGYLKSKDIITGSTSVFKNNTNDVSTTYVNIHKTKRIFHYSPNGQCKNPSEVNGQNFYYNDSLDNSLTFEDGIIFGCLKRYENNEEINNVLTLNPLTQFKDSDANNVEYITISKFGNPTINKDDFLNFEKFEYNNLLSTTCTNEICTLSLPTLNILYAETGATNNVQNSIMFAQIKSTGKVTVKQINNFYPLYTKVNFFKHTPNKKWWYAPGPGFIKLPRNVMYPFRIGTTTYQVKNTGN